MWRYRDDIRAIWLARPGWGICHGLYGGGLCGTVWKCFTLIQTTYYVSNWPRPIETCYTVATVQMADKRAENGGHVVAIGRRLCRRRRAGTVSSL